MKPAGILRKCLPLALGLGVVLSMGLANAATDRATVRAVRGTADVKPKGKETWQSLRVGRRLSPGATVRTGPNSEVDLFMRNTGPVVRITENTELLLDKLFYQPTGQETVIDTNLDLKSGRILGKVNKMAAASKYEVKTPVGVASIRGTEYDIDATGKVTVISGSVVISVTPPSGIPITQVVNAGQTFDPATGQVSPAEGVVLDGQGNVIAKPPAFTEIDEIADTPPEVTRPRVVVPPTDPDPDEQTDDAVDEDPTDENPYGAAQSSGAQ